MINSYAKAESRIYRDESGALRILAQDKKSIDQNNIVFNSANLSNWFKWRKEDYEEKLYPSEDLTRDWYVNFLITQNTKNSLQQALILNPSNLNIIEKYANKLDELSVKDTTNSKQLKEKASWYRSKLNVVPVSRE